VKETRGRQPKRFTDVVVEDSKITGIRNLKIAGQRLEGMVKDIIGTHSQR
jgi:hypothetical protein